MSLTEATGTRVANHGATEEAAKAAQTPTQWQQQNTGGASSGSPVWSCAGRDAKGLLMGNNGT